MFSLYLLRTSFVHAVFNFNQLIKNKNCEISRSAYTSFRSTLCPSHTAHKRMFKQPGKLFRQSTKIMLDRSYISRNFHSNPKCVFGVFAICVFIARRQKFYLYWSFLLANYGSRHTFQDQIYAGMADEPMFTFHIVYDPPHNQSIPHTSHTNHHAT